MAEEIINKVASSSLSTLNLEDFFPKNEVLVFDLKDYLFMELILKEKSFRESLQQLDWSIYQDKIVAVTCSADAIIPVWAYMLVATYLQPRAKEIIMGSESSVVQQIILKRIEALDASAFRDQRIVVKGCGDLPVNEAAFMAITQKLQPVVKSIMYGEPCSTVPIYKRR